MRMELLRMLMGIPTMEVRRLKPIEVVPDYDTEWAG